MKKQGLLSYIMLLAFTTSFSQDRYIIFFTDKNNSPYSVQNPAQFLSQRAIDRRTANGITIDQLDLPVTPQYIQDVAGTGVTVLNVSRWHNAAIIQDADPSVLAQVLQLPFVNSSSLAGKIRNTDPGYHEDRKFASVTYGHEPWSPTSLKRQALSYGAGTNQVNMINLHQLHAMGYTGQGKLIAVLDAGFLNVDQMPCFDSLFANSQITATWDFVDRESNVYNDNSHGTSVLSCIAANVPDTMVGTAPHAHFLLLRSEDAGSEYIIEEYNWAVAAEYADSAGADIINSSLGYYQFDNSMMDHTYADLDGKTTPVTHAAAIAASRGMIVVNSAGNEGNSNWNYIIAPADADSILALGGVDAAGQYAFFSSNGPTADGRVKPDIATIGQGTWLYSPFNTSAPVQGNGTSFSAPVMAGAVACLWQAWPGRNYMEVMNAVKQSASQYNNPDTLIGYGIPNLMNAYNLLGVPEINVPSGSVLHLYPNPWNGSEALQLIYSTGKEDRIEIRLIDISGRLVWSEGQPINPSVFNQIEINPELSKGCYLLEIRGADTVYSSRLIRF